MTRTKALDRARKLHAHIRGVRDAETPEQRVARRSLRRLQEAWQISNEELCALDVVELPVDLGGQEDWRGMLLAICAVPFEVKSIYNPRARRGWITGKPSNADRAVALFDRMVDEFQAGWEAAQALMTPIWLRAGASGRRSSGFDRDDDIRALWGQSSSFHRFGGRSRPTEHDWHITAVLALKERLVELRKRRPKPQQKPVAGLLELYSDRTPPDEDRLTEDEIQAFREAALRIPTVDERHAQASKRGLDSFQPVEDAFDFVDELDLSDLYEDNQEESPS